MAPEGERGRLLFPRLDPAVIMAVFCGDWLLLGRNARWAPLRFSLLAGVPYLLHSSHIRAAL